MQPSAICTGLEGFERYGLLTTVDTSCLLVGVRITPVNRVSQAINARPQESQPVSEKQIDALDDAAVDRLYHDSLRAYSDSIRRAPWS